MNDDIDLQGEHWEQELQQALSRMPRERAPASLRRRLRRIPARQGSENRSRWRWPAWGFALALVPIVLAGLLYREQLQQRQLEQELAMARQDLAVALHYLERANRQVGRTVITTVDEGVSRPVSDSTYELLREHLDMTQEL